jgi:hypothetical protein
MKLKYSLGHQDMRVGNIRFDEFNKYSVAMSRIGILRKDDLSDLFRELVDDPRNIGIAYLIGTLLIDPEGIKGPEIGTIALDEVVAQFEALGLPNVLFEHRKKLPYPNISEYLPPADTGQVV